MAGKIKNGDTVIVISGDDKGMRGEVREVHRAWVVDSKGRRARRDPSRDTAFERGENLVKKHQRPISHTRTQTGIITIEAPIYLSKLMLLCSNCNEPTRVRFEYEEDGRKVRVCRHCGQAVDK